MEAVDAITRTSTWDGVPKAAWLAGREAVAPAGVRPAAAVRGWNDPHVAALLFNVDCNDSYVAAYLLNLGIGGRP